MSQNIQADGLAGLIDFLKKCPTAFHTAASVASILDRAGFVRLSEADR